MNRTGDMLKKFKKNSAIVTLKGSVAVHFGWLYELLGAALAVTRLALATIGEVSQPGHGGEEGELARDNVRRGALAVGLTAVVVD